MATAGASALGSEAAKAGAGLTADMAANLADAGITDAGIQSLGNVEAANQALQQQAAERVAAASPFDRISAGASKVASDPMSFVNKDNFKYLAAAAAPVLADQAVTSKLPVTTTKPGMIRPYSFDPYGGTYTAGTPYEATPTKAAGGGLMGMDDGGYSPGQLNFAERSEPVVRMASGGIAGYAAGGVSDADILGWFNANPGANDQLIAQTMQQAGVTPDQVARATGTDYANVNERYLAATAPTSAGIASLTNTVADTGGGGTAAGTNYQTVNDLYQGVLGRGAESEGAAGYWQNLFGPTIDANEVAQFQTAAQAELAGRNAGTAGGLNALAATTPFTNQYTYANINDYIANNNLDAAGIAAAAKQFNVDPAQITAAQNAQSVVSNVFRNVLGRDPDPNGLDYWTNQIMTGKSTGQEMLDTFIKNAQANKEIIVNPNIKLEDAVKEFGGYKSSNARDIADEWVRNTLGREVTEADRKQQWYKDAVNDAVMNTYGKAQDIYGGFKTYAQGEATVATAKAINDATTALAARGLTEADVVKQTGKTIAELVAGGTNLGLDLYQASQLKAPGAASKFDFSTIQKAKAVPPVIPNTFGGGPVARTETNPYGNATNPGDITRNPDGTITVQPNIPYRPYGGFSGMDEVKGAYTRGGGSLGYTPNAPKTMDEFNARYNKQTGDSLAAYNYLMGKGANPIKSGVGQISRPYAEATMGYPESTNKMYNWDAASGKMVRNPDYVAPGRDAEGNVTYGMSLSDIKKYLGEKPLAGQELFDWAQSNGVSAQDVADATGRKLSEVYAEFRTAAKKTADAKVGTGVGESGTYDSGGGGDGGGEAAGGLQNSYAMGGYAMGGYAVGGGLGSLGSYSDGGRLLKGPGDGVSDSIPATIGAKNQPARLADGEFVVPARIVSELGNGSTEAGAKKLYAMMDRVQRARGKTTGKNKVAANSRADKYLPA
jgi:hypothetical protein